MRFKTGFLSLPALCIGPIADKALSVTTDGVVMGVSSRGIYLCISADQVVYLSSENFRGPLTVNVPLLQPSLRTVSPGLGCQVTPGKILIPAARIEILADNCPLWQPPLRPQPKPQAEQHRILEAFTAGIPGWRETQDRWNFSIQEAADLLGQGEGLTPFGDDILIGLLLCLNRWGDILEPGVDLLAFSRHIIESAYRKTTTLSANLIASAARGQAEERLIRACDHLMSAHGDPHHILPANHRHTYIPRCLL